MKFYSHNFSVIGAVWLLAVTVVAQTPPSVPNPNSSPTVPPQFVGAPRATIAPPAPVAAPQAIVPAPPTSKDEMARQRYDEMLGKMQRAVEETAQLYGNPLFVQLFTNDRDKALEFRRRLAATESNDAMKKQIDDLTAKRDELLKDIALRERESASLGERLARQRATLDQVAKVVEAAQKNLETSIP